MFRSLSKTCYVDLRTNSDIRSRSFDLLPPTRASHRLSLAVKPEDSITLAGVRRLFDALILRFLSICEYLSELAEIVDNPQFEAAIVESFTVPYEDLKLAEKVHLGRFRTQQEASHANADVETGHKSFAESVLFSPEPVPALKTMMKLLVCSVRIKTSEHPCETGSFH